MAKAAIVGMTVVLARELERYGVLVNALAPSAFRTRLLSGPARQVEAGQGADAGWDPLDPAHLGSTVVWLAAPSLPFSGQVVWSSGDSVELYDTWRPVSRIGARGRAVTFEELSAGTGEMLAGKATRPRSVPPQGSGHWDWFYAPSGSRQASSPSRR